MPVYGWFLIPVAVVLIVALLLMRAKIEAPASAATPIAIDGKCKTLEGVRYLEYRVGVKITASSDAIWALLTDAEGYPTWNSTVVKIDGKIGPDERIGLVAKVAPERTFGLTVSTFQAPEKMVWEDGNKAFRGVRTFTLTEGADGTTDVTMAEVLTGILLPMIKGKLPDFAPSFDAFAADLKTAAQRDPDSPAVEA